IRRLSRCHVIACYARPRRTPTVRSAMAMLWSPLTPRGLPMMKLIALPSAIGLLITLCLHTTPAQALEARTWVSTAGNDASDCSRATPCASFLTAHNKTLPGGEINCVDAGMFSIDFPLNITKSITIDCAGTLGGLMGNAIGEVITINTANINVRLRNLTINGLGANFIGINFQNGNALFVENCTIFGFNGGVGHGISFKPANGFTSQLYVTDSVVEGNGLFSGSGGGIIIQPSGSGSARVVIDRTRVNSNIYGIFANGTGSTGTIAVQVKDSTVSGNAFNGISAFTSAG